jgi:hypothetical protein
MGEEKQTIINELKEIFSSLSADNTSARLVSASYNILDLLIKLNTLEPGSCRKEILALSLTLGNEVAYAHEIAKEIYLKNLPYITVAELLQAKKAAIEKIRTDLQSLI